MIIVCDKCSNEFVLTSIKTKRLQKYIVGYFICPRCKHEYISYVTDKETKRLQLKIKSLGKKIATIAKMELPPKRKLGKVEAVEKQIKQLKHQIDVRMDRLKDEYLSNRQ